MELHAMGISYRHDEDFCIDRPEGSGDNLLLIFKTPAFVASGNTEIAVSENSAVVYAKGTPIITGYLRPKMPILRCLIIINGYDPLNLFY